MDEGQYNYDEYDEYNEDYQNGLDNEYYIE